MPRTASSTRILSLSVCAFALLCGPSPAQRAKPHRAPKQVQEQIVHLEEQWKTATLTGNIALMDNLLSEDYVGISWNGQVNTKTEQLDRLRNRTLTVTRLDLSDMKVKLLGPVAIVTCRATAEGINDGAPLTGTYRYTRVYQRLPNGVWKITNFEATRIPNHLRNGPAPPASPTSGQAP